MMNEEYAIPDKLVGFVIGKGGEQIIRLQTDSGCKIQIAQDSGGLPTRSCTLTGTPESITICRQMLNAIVERGRQTASVDQLPPGTVVQELQIPGQKAGLVIGKGGDTIKRLQEENRVKMVMIQDSTQPTMQDKPLRITGAEADVMAAKEQVLSLLASKDMEPPNRGGFGDFSAGQSFNSFGSFGGGPRRSMEVAVPGRLVGAVIGKQGEMIHKIQSESDARIQFKKQDEPGLSERLCMITGTPQALQHAEGLIRKVVSDALQREQGGSGRSGYGEEDFTQFPVPNEKCGFVIGKGGENIKQINTATGAHVEISKEPPPSATEKLFNIKGSPEQIRHAIRMICERAGLTAPAGPPGPGGPPQGATWAGPQAGGTQGYAGGASQQWQAPYDKPNSFGAVDNSWPLYNNAAQNTAPQSSITQPTIDPLTGQPDYTQAWVEYFRQQNLADRTNALLSGQTGAAGTVQSTPQPATAPAAGQQAVSGYQFAAGTALPFNASALQGYGQSFAPTAAGYQQSSYSAPQ